MTTVNEQIRSADEAICRNIELLPDQRALLSQNILAQLRNLVEGVAVRLHTGSPDAEFNYADIDPWLAFVKSKGKLNFLSKFHKLIQKIASHYTLDGDASERLMLKYYEYLYRIRSLVQDQCNLDILSNLEAFPIDLDPSMREYHEKIAARIDAGRHISREGLPQDRYYIHKIRPFFSEGRIYYEATLYRAINKVNKFDRIIAFTAIDMTSNYAGMLRLQRDSIEVLGQTMPITIVREWEVSIRPCEFNNFARIFDIDLQSRTALPEYQFLMKHLTASWDSLLDLLEMTDAAYSAVKTAGTAGVRKPVIFPVLDKARHLVWSAAPGQNVVRYLMLRMHNQVLKSQYDREGCELLSGMKVPYGCIPFDTMPFCTSLIGHNPRHWDLIESLDAAGRKHELLARRVKNNVERRGMLYTPVGDLDEFGDVSGLISTYNSKLHRSHAHRRLLLDKDHAFISGYENDTVSIIAELIEYASSGITGYTQAVQYWLDQAPRGIDDHAKENALKQLFSQSRVALIYGAAGTGKSTMVDLIARYFNDKRKLFLAHTNPAIDNLKGKVSAQNSEFRTISSHTSRRASDSEFDLVIIDECSTVSNTDLIKVLEKSSYKLLVLVGDVYQIESIQFGNWFGLARSFIPKASVFELTTPFRTKSEALLEFWGRVRHIGDDIAEIIAKKGYSTVLDKTLFEAQAPDEIILCLNYDGLYGINNINRFLQSSNPGAATTWRMSTYKIGDPVLFHEAERFRPAIYNNLKGKIIDIHHILGQIRFDIELERPLTELDFENDELEWMGGSIVRFTVYEVENTSDEDDDSLNTTVPFQVAYAVSIHKAQGLEYESVKIVITDANEDDITHSIFYTAVTRARDRLQIFWTPETQQGVLKQLRHNTSPKDVALLANRRSLVPVN